MAGPTRLGRSGWAGALRFPRGHAGPGEACRGWCAGAFGGGGTEAAAPVCEAEEVVGTARILGWCHGEAEIEKLEEAQLQCVEFADRYVADLGPAWKAIISEPRWLKLCRGLAGSFMMISLSILYVSRTGESEVILPAAIKDACIFGEF